MTAGKGTGSPSRELTLRIAARRTRSRAHTRRPAEAYHSDTASFLQTTWPGARMANGVPVINESVFRDYRNPHR